MGQRQPLVLNAGQQQQLQSADYINTGIPFWMHKNRILNGDFNVWQRGTALNTITTTGTYYPDQWRADFNGASPSLSIQQKAFTGGQTNVPDNPLYYCECSVSVGASGQTVLAMDQRIESCFHFSGQTATVSFWAKADTTRTLSVRIDRHYGTGGSPSSDDIGIAGGAQSFSLTTSWQKFTATFAIPSISGKTLGTNGDDWLSIIFLFPVNTGFTIDISHVQFEEGGNATQFEYRHVQHELNLCKRYFEAIVGGGQAYNPIAIGGWTHLSGANGVMNAFLGYAQKRVIPTISTPDPAGNFFINCNNGPQACQAISFPADSGLTWGIVEGDPITYFTGTQLGQAASIQANNTSTARVWISAEL